MTLLVDTPLGSCSLLPPTAGGFSKGTNNWSRTTDETVYFVKGNHTVAINKYTSGAKNNVYKWILSSTLLKQ